MPVTVVIGNPPYKSGSAGEGGWVELGSDEAGSPPPILDDWRSNASGGHRQFTNLYTYFWRWATWKVFEASGGDGEGLVSYITSAGWLDGGDLWSGMRAWLRQECDFIWVVDLEGDKNNPRSSENVFDIKVPVAIVIGLRTKDHSDSSCETQIARLRGSRATKLRQLAEAGSLADLDWSLDAGTGGDPIRPSEREEWLTYPDIPALHPWASPGVSANRTWVIAPSASTLEERWVDLVARTADPDDMRLAMKESRDAKVDITKPALAGHPHMDRLLDEPYEPLPQSRKPVRFAYRSFDRQWIIPDSRLIHDPRPDLWEAHGANQVYLSHHNKQKGFTTGPSCVLTSAIPEVDAFNANSAGRVVPMWRDSACLHPNTPPGLLSYLSERLGTEVTVPDLFAYEAAVLAHPGYLERFFDDLDVPNPRVPLTADPEVWEKAIELGAAVGWTQTFGERFSDAARERPMSDVLSTIPAAIRPALLAPVPSSAAPEYMEYRADPKNKGIGQLVLTSDDEPEEGVVSNVLLSAFEYEVSGLQVVRRWFGYRQRSPRGRRNPPLSDIHAGVWHHEFDLELLELIGVLNRLVSLESDQSDLLEEVLASELITELDLRSSGALRTTRSDLGPVSRQGTLGSA